MPISPSDWKERHYNLHSFPLFWFPILFYQSIRCFFFFLSLKDFLQTAISFAVKKDIYAEENPFGQNQAILKNMSILKLGVVKQEEIGRLRPEQIRSVELGYKTNLADKLYIDAAFYRSNYQNFIGITEVIKPKTSPEIDLFTAANQVNNSIQRDVYYIYTNSGKKVTIQGLTVGIKYLTPLGTILSANATWSDIRNKEEDPIIPGFNTPGFKSNVSVSNRRLDKMENNPDFKNVGFNVVWRWQSAIDWESPFADGRLEPVSTFNVQVSYTFTDPKSILKVGVSNFFDILYTNSFGGVQVGAFYYISYSIENLFK